jgi:ribosome biogenesis GTPase / thiamine phosphate phosphatase
VNATIVAAFGRQFLARTDAGELIRCVTRGKRTDLACGDRVITDATSRDEAVIESIETRRSLIRRSSHHRTKLLAANVDQVVVVVAVEPSFSDELIARVLAAARSEDVRTLIALNKVDVASGLEAARARLAPFATVGHELIELSALNGNHAGIRMLESRLRGANTLLVGQSGMGKSTILNALVPDAHAATNDISYFLSSGRHTTTAGRLYALPHGGTLIDCPGMQEYGLAHLSRSDIEHSFVELGPYMGRCRFSDCRHAAEPGCAIKQAAADGAIDARRYELFQRIVAAEGR